MQNDRLKTLIELEKSDNKDVTIKYMIAIEYLNSENPKCDIYFNTLLTDFKDYLPTYYIAGEHYYNKEQYEKSAEILNKGLLIAKKEENQKTYNEIQNLLLNVEFEL